MTGSGFLYFDCLANGSWLRLRVGGAKTYPYQVVPCRSPSTDGGGGGGAGEYIQHKSDGVDTLMGCPGPLLELLFWKRDKG